MAALQTQLDELGKAQGLAYVSTSLTEAEKEKQHQEDLQRLRGLRLIDDDFMNACFDGYTNGAELLLRILLNKPDIRVKSVKTQQRMKNLLGRDICLDIDADDGTGKEYNVEVQWADKGADRRLTMIDQMKDMKYRPYSQCGEDRIIELLFTKLSVSQWTWLDIGAGDPLILSNTALFYERGCRGINVEPNIALYRSLCECRPEDVNLNIGVGTEPGYLEYYMFEEDPYLNTCVREEALSLVNKFGYQIADTRRIPVMTINQIVEQYCQSQFPDVLDLDMEGMDLDILSQIDFNSSSPKIIVLETVQFGSVRKDTTAKDFLEKQGYIAPYETPINTLFVRRDCWEKML